MIKGAVIQYFCIIIIGIFITVLCFFFLQNEIHSDNPYQNKQGTDGRTCELLECFVAFVLPAR